MTTQYLHNGVVMENFLQRLLRFYPLQAPSKVFSFLVLFLIVAAVPLTVYLAQQQQEIRSRAQQSASSTYFGNSKVSPALLDFGSVDKSKPEVTQYLTVEYIAVSSPSASTSKITPTSAFGVLLPSKNVSFALSSSTQAETVGSTFSAQLFLNVGANSITGVDVTIKYNKDVLEVNGFEPLSVFNTQLINNFDNQSGALHYSAVNTQGSVGGTVNMGTITFRAKAQGTSSVTIENVQITAIGQNESLKTSNDPIGSYAVVSAAPSVYSLSLKKSIPGANITFSENQFSLKKGENKPVQATLSIDPNTIKEGAYSNEVILTTGNNNYLIPLNFTYSMPLIAKLGLGAKPTLRAQEISSENRGNTEEPKYQGYIVEFKKEPLVEFREKKKKEGESISALEAETRDHKRALQEEHEQAKADILSRLGQEPEISARGVGGGRQVILREYDTVFNGIALNISDEQKERIKESPFVKKISPNYQVKALLNDSVPLVNANQVWSLASSSGPVTGRGTTIAVIDTGVDYTHPDLGETRITERAFDQITPNPITPFTNSQHTLDQIISLNNNRVAYLSGNKIYIYSFNTQTTEEIFLFAENLTPQRVVLRDNILVYIGVDRNARGALYLTNLTTGEKRKIVDADEMSLVSIIDGKVVYGRNNGDDPSVNVYVYDITSRRETAVTNQRGYVYFPKASGNKVVWPVVGERCYDKAVVYDINTGQSQDIVPPDIGPILDFKDNRILYVACSKESFDKGWKTSYLYDIETRARTRLFYGLPQEVGVGNVMSQEHGGFGMWSWISKGGIGEGVVYFAKNADANRIIVYDQGLNRYVQVNLLRTSGDFEVEGRKVCFMASDNRIYCHTYNPDDPYSQPETIFNEKVVGGYNFVYNDDDPYDDNGHGTHVAAIAASTGNLKGVAPGAKIVAYKVLNSYGSGWVSDIVAALERAVQSRLDNNPSNDIDVVNMSLGMDCWGRYDWWCGPNDWMSWAVDNTVDAGIVVVVSAGNSGPNPQTIGSPGTARKAITVGAVYKNRQIARFSSRGPVPVFRSNEANSTPDEVVVKPDIVAPGVGICAAKANSSSRSECIDGNHVSLNGTSMAAPHIAGVAALLKQKNPLWSPEEIKAAIKSTAVNLGEDLYQDTSIYGAGLVDAFAAASRPPTSPVLTPTGPTRSSIYVSIKVPGIGDGARENRNPGRRERIVYVSVRNTDGRIIKTVRGSVNFDGTNYIGPVDLENIYSDSHAAGGGSGGGAGSYYITAKLDNSLSGLVSSSPIEIRPGMTANLPTVTLTLGDINNDNVVNISDFGQLRRCFFKNTQSPEWNTCQTSDLNEDGRISITDYSRLVTNFGRRGE